MHKAGQENRQAVETIIFYISRPVYKIQQKYKKQQNCDLFYFFLVYHPLDKAGGIQTMALRISLVFTRAFAIWLDLYPRSNWTHSFLTKENRAIFCHFFSS